MWKSVLIAVLIALALPAYAQQTPSKKLQIVPLSDGNAIMLDGNSGKTWRTVSCSPKTQFDTLSLSGGLYQNTSQCWVEMKPIQKQIQSAE
jgi:hypothetical protein